MSSLDDLRAAVTAAADKVTSLKSSGGSPEDVKAAVMVLLSAKKVFAEANGGIGVDGKVRAKLSRQLTPYVIPSNSSPLLLPAIL